MTPLTRGQAALNVPDRMYCCSNCGKFYAWFELLSAAARDLYYVAPCHMSTCQGATLRVFVAEACIHDLQDQAYRAALLQKAGARRRPSAAVRAHRPA